MPAYRHQRSSNASAPWRARCLRRRVTVSAARCSRSSGPLGRAAAYTRRAQDRDCRDLVIRVVLGSGGVRGRPGRLAPVLRWGAQRRAAAGMAPGAPRGRPISGKSGSLPSAGRDRIVRCYVRASPVPVRTAELPHMRRVVHRDQNPRLLQRRGARVRVGVLAPSKFGRTGTRFHASSSAIPSRPTRSALRHCARP